MKLNERPEQGRPVTSRMFSISKNSSVVCGGLLLLHALLLAWATWVNSATYDEPSHLAAGVAYWRQGDFSIYALSPPLLRLWSAAPAVCAGAQSPDTQPFHQYHLPGRRLIYTDPFVAANAQQFPRLLILARLAMIPWSLLAGWIVFRWTRTLYGPAAGIAACTLYCFNPGILANGFQITTDIGTVATLLAAAWLWWLFCQKPSVLRWIGCCLALLAAHLCKFTAVMIWPMMFAMAIPFIWLQPEKWRKILIGWIGAAAMTVVLLNTVYAFHGSGRRLDSFSFDSKFMKSIQQTLPAGFPSPLPQLLVEGFDAQKFDTETGYQGFLLGEIYSGSRWYYYPVALACKTPMAAIALLAIAAMSLFIPRRALFPGTGAGESSLLLAALIYLLGVLLLSDVNIGTRYLLPAFPLVMILTARSWAIQIARPMRLALNVLLVVAVAEVLPVSPRFLTFTNLAAGGSTNGWQLVTDSEFDCGQGLIDLRHWMNNNQVNRVTLAYFGFIDPHIYGIEFTSLADPKNDKYVAISSYYLNGLYGRMMTTGGPHPVRHIAAIPFYKALQTRTPVAIVGNVIFIYRLEDVQYASLETPATN